MSLAHAFARFLDEERGRWFLWVPVFFGAGIAAYFSLYNEPSPHIAGALVVAVSGLCLSLRAHPLALACATALLCAALGFANAMLRTALVDAPTLSGPDRAVRLTAWVEGTEGRNPAGARMLLRPIIIVGMQPEALPFRIRVTSRFVPVPATGDAIQLRAVLRAVPQPVMPNGFDFARKAYFSGLGAVGFALSEAQTTEMTSPPPPIIRFKALIDTARRTVQDRIVASLTGQSAAIAVALTTGDRGRIPEETLQSLRDSGLAHLLAISGMHMALMAGTLYWLVRAAAALWPVLALRYPVKKWAAVFALVGGAFYLALSGASVATQRSFLMMAILFTAILLNRPALTLRNVALAALFILILFPESLLDVSFQMSFAAVTALIAVYERLDRRRNFQPRQSLLWCIAGRTGAYIIGIALTTLIASIAIAPFAAFHFHKLAQYSLLANLAAMPVFGLLVMPFALGSLISMPLGLEHYPLQIMAYGVEHIATIAAVVSGWEGATIPVATMPVISLLALVLGGLWLTLWETRWRYLGLPIAMVGALAAGSQAQPDLLVDREGDIVAMRTQTHALAITGTNRSNYSIEQWLKADGDSRTPLDVLKTKGFNCDELACVGEADGKSVAFVLHPAALNEECRRAHIVISRVPIPRRCPSARVRLDPYDMKREGAHALFFDGQSIRVETAARARGSRPWAPNAIRDGKREPSGTAFAGDGAQ